jgi:hypothetical protein
VRLGVAQLAPVVQLDVCGTIAAAAGANDVAARVLAD